MERRAFFTIISALSFFKKQAADRIGSMKKVLITFFSALVIVLSLSASDTSNPWALKSIKLGIGNDKYAYGLSRNDDDQLSYSEHISLSGERWYLSADLDGITNRGWKTGWDIRDASVADASESDWYEGRLDVTVVRAGLNYSFPLSGAFAVTVSPETGFFLSGYTGYDTLQNLIHRMAGIHRVDLPYDYSDIRFHYYLGLKGELFWNICSLDSSYLSFVAGGTVSHAFGFESTEKISATLTVQNDYSEIIALTFGWNWTQEHNSSKTMELYARYITSPYLAYRINTGLFTLDYFTELTDHFGYAVLSVDLMSFFHPTIWRENNFYLSMGFADMLGIKFQDQELNWPINDNWSIVLKNRYVAGYPTDREIEREGNPKLNARLKMGHVMDTLGFEFSCPIAALKNWVAPYVSFSLGYMRWDHTLLTNMLKDVYVPSMTWSMNRDEHDGYDHSFVVDLEGGVTLIPEGLVSFNSSSLTVSVFAGLSYVTGDFVKGYRQVSEENIMNWTYEPTWKDNFIFRWGLTLNFGFDI